MGEHRLQVAVGTSFIGLVVRIAVKISTDGIEGVPVKPIHGINNLSIIETLHPCGNVIHVIGAGHPIARLGIIPVSGICSVSGRQDGTPVLDGDPDDLRPEIRRHAQLVGDGGRPQVAGRHRLRFRRSSNGRDGGIFHTIDGTAKGPLIPIVSHDPVDGGGGAGINGCVTGCGDRLRIWDESVLTSEPFAEHPLQSTLAISMLEAVEIIPSHLIDHNSNDQLWTSGLASGRLQPCKGCDQEQQGNRKSRNIHENPVL